eukprot:TRINITY_DN25174_c0_g1_i4.p2 TRINITY_DN25174_c0_g1~~TRINITY_DN25174_c0_g1_i4.p2  ORF type:complete len:107 (-),score=14.57 TRINITY_DN25174_c0_g1_i4:159-479(-)
MLLLAVAFIISFERKLSLQRLKSRHQRDQRVPSFCGREVYTTFIALPRLIAHGASRSPSLLLATLHTSSMYPAQSHHGIAHANTGSFFMCGSLACIVPRRVPICQK